MASSDDFHAKRCFPLNTSQNSILKSNETQLHTGALCILFTCEYSNTHFSNAVLRFHSFLDCHPHINTSQDAEGSAISIAPPIAQCVYLAPCPRATVKTQNQKN